ncbi:MAG: glycine cleavage system aminomethyltransferase GcvT [Nitrococcus sp.]|nr:glycine cleavage system aminomethyltransferase GcvT [Nitrococcus sp.]
MGYRTALYDKHSEAGARIVGFAGWDMPIQYASQIEEHRAVRRDAGLFDVSHMAIVELTGAEIKDCLRYLLANDVAKLKEQGKALYTCLLNERGGVLDDLIVYRLADGHYRGVLNAATRDKDLAWIRAQSKTFRAQVEYRDDLAMLAVQGPEARDKVLRVLPSDVAAGARTLAPFTGCERGGVFASRTGYTGEDGYEIMLPADHAPALWDALREQGVHPCGLGARDTLRIEAGMNLYGQDMNETVTPLECGLAWTVAWGPAERDFIGREALEAQRRAGVQHKLVGLVLEARGVIRAHQGVRAGELAGTVTSGSFAPTLGKSIGLARVPIDIGERCEVEIRDRFLPARVVKPPFVRRGRILV